jgi:hypothetical protein
MEEICCLLYSIMLLACRQAGTGCGARPQADGNSLILFNLIKNSL